MARAVIPYRPRYPHIHATMEVTRYCVLVAHRRFGKTVLAVNHLIKMAIKCALPDGHFGYVAPLRHQAKTIAWKYLKHFTSGLPGVSINESELSATIPARGGRAVIRLFGADNPDALRGAYFDGVVLDEVAQMKPDVWDEIIQPALADRHGFAVFLGTPKGVNLFSRLYSHALEEQAKGGPWAALRFPVTETKALSEADVEQLRLGMSENKFRQEMLCDFTASADDILITLDMVDAALDRQADMELAAQWPLILGVDIARFGSDATVFFARRGNLALAPVIHRKKSNTDIAHRLIDYITNIKPRIVNIDQGQGTGVIDIVRDMSPASCRINEIPFGSKALAPDRYVNRRCEMWARIGQWLKGGGTLPKAAAELLRDELTAPTYTFDAQGRMKLESKDEIKKRLRRSTDIGDALALTFAINTGIDDRTPARTRRSRKIYDPFRQ